MKSRKMLFFSVVASSLFATFTAYAESVELSAECTWHAGFECQTSCANLSVHTACEGEVKTSCSIEDCTGIEAELDCQANCQGECEPLYCEGDLGNFSCSGACSADCSADCSGTCEGSCEAECSAKSDSTECKASCQSSCEVNCETSCSGKCNAECEGTPPNIDCEGGCSASCEGSCKAKAEINCDIDCKNDEWIDCSTKLRAKCTAGCEGEGYLECNGDYVDITVFDKAVAWVKEHFELTYDGEASSECTDGKCEASASGSVKLTTKNTSCSQSFWSSQKERSSLYNLLLTILF